MRKFKALIAVLTAAVLVLSLVGTAFAASAPSDVQGTKYEAAATKLMAYGISSGWGGGKFNPSAAVTRAQFSVLVVNELGLKAVAEALQGSDTQFKDVKGSYWASGAIQVATTKGIISGYGDGTFRPEQPITYMEAAILTVRALGYREADPNAHFIKAIELGLMANVDGKANQTAIRGNLAIILDNMLSKQIGEVNKDGVWTSTGKTPVDKLELNTGAIVNYVVQPGDAAAGSLTVSGTTYKLASNCYFVGAADLASAVGFTVNATLKAGEVIYVEVVNRPAQTKSGTIDSTGTDATGAYLLLKGDTTKYYKAASCTVVLNGGSADWANLAAGQEVTLSLDKDGKIYLVKASAFTVSEAQVSKVDTVNKAIYYNNDANWLVVADNAKLLRNGQQVTLGDIKAKDVIYLAVANVGGINKVTYAEAYYNQVTGVISAVKSVVGEVYPVVTVDGKDYMRSKNPITANNDPKWDQMVVGKRIDVLLNKDGRMTVVNKVEDVPAATATGKVVTVGTKADGTKYVTLDVRGTNNSFDIASGGSVVDSVYLGKFITVTLDKDNKVTTFKDVNPNTLGLVTEVYPAQNTVVLSVEGTSTSYTVDTNTIISRNGSYTGFNSIAVNDGVKFYQESNKIVVLLADSCVVDTSKISATTDKLTGAAGAVEKGATVEVFSNAAMTTQVGSDVVANDDGSFQYAYGSSQASGTTLWVKVTDTQGFGGVQKFAVVVP